MTNDKDFDHPNSKNIFRALSWHMHQIWAMKRWSVRMLAECSRNCSDKQVPIKCNGSMATARNNVTIADVANLRKIKFEARWFGRLEPEFVHCLNFHSGACLFPIRLCDCGPNWNCQWFPATDKENKLICEMTSNDDTGNWSCAPNVMFQPQQCPDSWVGVREGQHLCVTLLGPVASLCWMCRSWCDW